MVGRAKMIQLAILAAADAKEAHDFEEQSAAI